MNEKISLQQLLASRDARAAHQRELILRFNATLISFMVNMPGEIKYCALTEALHSQGMQLLEQRLGSEGLSCMHSEVRRLETGIEGFVVVDAPPQEVKRICCIIEDEHPLGRLFDFDVLENFAPLSRTELGFPARKCLICGREGAACARSRTHPVQEVIDKMQRIYDDFCSAV